MCVKCPICNKEFKEINNSHLSKHNLTSEEFNNIYPDFERYCENSFKKIKKDKNLKKWLNKKENVDFVICPICNGKFKEINNFHLAFHNLNAIEFDTIYPNNKRLSEIIDKNNFKNLTKEMSDKLKRSHTLDNFIDKYGEDDGRRKFLERKENMIRCKKIEYFIEKYGESEGINFFNDVQKSRGVTLEKYINKYGEEEGTIKYEKYRETHKKSKSLNYFISLYGEEDGLKRWFEKNNKISKSHRKINIEQLKEFELYKLNVDKFTRLSLQMNNMNNIDKRGKKFHLDHKYSKADGFLNNIPPEIVGHISNLEIVDQHYNSSKQHKSDIDIEIISEKFNIDFPYQERCKNLLSS